METITLNGSEAEPAAEPAGSAGGSVVTLVGLVEGDVLAYLEGHGSATLRELIRALEWSAPLVTMGVGALIRQGLVRGIRHDLEVVLEVT